MIKWIIKRSLITNKMWCLFAGWALGAVQGWLRSPVDLIIGFSSLCIGFSISMYFNYQDRKRADQIAAERLIHESGHAH